MFDVSNCVSPITKKEKDLERRFPVKKDKKRWERLLQRGHSKKEQEKDRRQTATKDVTANVKKKEKITMKKMMLQTVVWAGMGTHDNQSVHFSVFIFPPSHHHLLLC